MSGLKYIIFDFDGTISNTLPVWLKGFKDTFIEFGYAYSTEEVFNQCIGVYGGAVNLGIKPSEVGIFYNKLNDKVKVKLAEAKPFSGFINTAQALINQNYSLSVLTSSKKESVEEYLKQNSIHNLFDVVVGSFDVKHLKPDPEGVNIIMEYYKDTKKANYLLVGDSSKDILAGKNAGVKTALFVPRNSVLYRNLEKQKKLLPDLVFNNWSDFTLEDL